MTPQQRAQSIFDGVINGSATAVQINRYGAALAEMTGQADHYAQLTNADKYRFIVRGIREHVIGMIDAADRQIAARTATSGGATDLPEAP